MHRLPLRLCPVSPLISSSHISIRAPSNRHTRCSMKCLTETWSFGLPWSLATPHAAVFGLCSLKCSKMECLSHFVRWVFFSLLVHLVTIVIPCDCRSVNHLCCWACFKFQRTWGLMKTNKVERKVRLKKGEPLNRQVSESSIYATEFDDAPEGTTVENEGTTLVSSVF